MGRSNFGFQATFLMLWSARHEFRISNIRTFGLNFEKLNVRNDFKLSNWHSIPAFIHSDSYPRRRSFTLLPVLTHWIVGKIALFLRWFRWPIWVSYSCLVERLMLNLTMHIERTYLKLYSCQRFSEMKLPFLPGRIDKLRFFQLTFLKPKVKGNINWKCTFWFGFGQVINMMPCLHFIKKFATFETKNATVENP